MIELQPRRFGQFTWRFLTHPKQTHALLCSLIAVMLFSPSHSGSAIESPQRGTGLEASGSVSVPVLVEDVSAEAQKRGITRDRIEARANAVLRKSGLKPFDDPGGKSGYNLYIKVVVAGNAFSVNMYFRRIVSYSDGDTPYRIVATTWRNEITGVSSSGSQYILDMVGDIAELFSNAYLKANNK